MKNNIKLFKKKPEDESLWTQPKTCKNCGHIGTGKYCSNCGQSFKEINRPFNYIFEDFFSIFNLDSSIFRTLIPFLFKPGFITREYIEGKRKTYMSPIRLYLFLSIIFFFLARMAAESSANPDTGKDEMNSNPATIIMDGDTLRAGSPGINSAEIKTEVDIDSIFSAMDEDPDRLGGAIKKLLEDKPLFYNKLLNNLSYGLFLLMPIFALILQVLYIRRKRYYIEHLIFTLNMHSFALLILSLVVSLNLLIRGNDNFAAYLLLIIPIYFTIGMKRFYKQGIFKTLLKELFLVLSYGLLLIVALTGLTLFTLYRL